MCYASYDPKYMMRDIEERVRGVSLQADAATPSAQVAGPAVGVWAFLTGLLHRRAPHRAGQPQ